MTFDVLIVGGFGRIGLPLGIFLADRGLRVALHDIDQTKRRVIESGRMPFFEHDAEPLLGQLLGTNLTIADGLADAARAECIIITIGTPLDEYMNPRLLPMQRLAEELIPHLTPDHHVMLRSTVSPGTSRQLYCFFARRGARVHFTVCPERIVQGYAMRELGSIPQIVSGYGEAATRKAEDFFERIGVRTIRLEPHEAELAKLFNNTWRYLQFAIANQLYMIANDAGADFDRIYHAMTWEYERARSFPRPGFAAGPCLLKDTLQLAATHAAGFPLGHQAMLVNEGLPRFIVDQLRSREGFNLAASRVGILGMAFKADIDDIRDSLSYKLAKILRFYGADVSCSDELACDPTFIKKEELVARCDAVIVSVPHTGYRDLEVPAGKLVIDPWGVLPR